jgi:glycosyltransferase involved in cell wall biosynthesis
MKIGYLITRSDTVGGAHVHVLDLAVRAQAEGHDVEVWVGGDGPYATLLRNADLKVRNLSHLTRPIKLSADVVAVLEIYRLIKEFDPDLIHTHSVKAGLLGRVAARLVNKPSVFTAHGWAFTEGIPERSRKLAGFLEQCAAKISDSIICVSEFDRGLALKFGVGDDLILSRIHNGVPDVPFNLRAIGSRGRSIKIVSVARLDAPKDHALLIDALATIKDLPWELELIGDGPLTESVQAKVAAIGIADRVIFSGLCNDVPRRLAGADLFVLVSGFEGFPLSILEAMRAKLPVIASNVGGVSESVMEGVTGFLVPKGEKGPLADRLRLLLGDRDLRLRLGEQGRALYERDFSFEVMFSRTFDVYRNVLKRRGSK